MLSKPQHRVLILDFGSQYAQLIARAVRELGVYCEVHPYTLSADFLRDYAPRGVILSGGPETVTGEQSPRAPADVFELGCPVLGICYGMQTMAHQLGGRVVSSQQREFGYAEVELIEACRMLQGLQDRVSDNGQAQLDVWMSHGDRVEALPPGFRAVAKTTHAPLAAMADEARQFYGVQFHPEVSQTTQGRALLQRFLRDCCNCDSSWTTENIIEASVASIKAQVGDESVLLGLSGGVDSAVAAALLQRALGKQLTCVFVDTGLLRQDEAAEVMTVFGERLGESLIKVDASQQFFQALAGVTCPETKRKIIGRLFIEVFEAEAKKIDGVAWLAQGTIYSDVIESAGTGGKTCVIKSHHNVGGLPEKMALKLVEPLRHLFKDEVRKLGVQLGLPAHMVYRHPFPGPGLAVRVLGEVTTERVALLQKADVIFIDSLRAAQWYDKVSQAFAVLLPVKSVGVMGDARRYDAVVALRAVETIDFMTASWAHLPYELLADVSHRIINEIDGISRVTYDISGKPPATIEWE